MARKNDPQEPVERLYPYDRAMVRTLVKHSQDAGRLRPKLAVAFTLVAFLLMATFAVSHVATVAWVVLLAIYLAGIVVLAGSGRHRKRN